MNVTFAFWSAPNAIDFTAFVCWGFNVAWMTTWSLPPSATGVVWTLGRGPHWVAVTAMLTVAILDWLVPSEAR